MTVFPVIIADVAAQVKTVRAVEKRPLIFYDMQRLMCYYSAIL